MAALSTIHSLLKRALVCIARDFKQIRHDLNDGFYQLRISIVDTWIRWRRMGFRKFTLTHKFPLFTLAAVIVSYLLHSFLLAMFTLSFLADAYVVWIIKSRLVKTLNSTAWYEIFLSKITSFFITGLAVYLIVNPSPQRGPQLAAIWFVLFALKRVLLAVGFGSMSHDLTATFESDKYVGSLPAVPPPNGHGDPDTPP